MKSISDDELASIIAGLILLGLSIFAGTVLYDFALYLKPNSVWYREGFVCFWIAFGLLK